MKREAVGPLSRPTSVERLLRDRAGKDQLGKDRPGVTVEASEAECAALAADFGIPAIRGLVGRFRLAGSLARLTVTGTVEARVTQVCTVSLEPFEAAMREEVEVDFSDGEVFTGSDAETVEVPDPIVDGRIDFGALTAEFLALGLDPFPKKPGVVFEPVSVGEDDSPFSELRKLRDEES